MKQNKDNLIKLINIIIKKCNDDEIQTDLNKVKKIIKNKTLTDRDLNKNYSALKKIVTKLGLEELDKWFPPKQKQNKNGFGPSYGIHNTKIKTKKNNKPKLK